MKTIHDVLARIRAEYLEMPGMRLTAPQVERLCGIEATVCQAVLDALVDAEFLCVKANRTYARVTDVDIPLPRPAKADLRGMQDVQKAS
jgi:hypothetical protein